MNHPIIIYYIAHKDIPLPDSSASAFSFTDPFTSDSADSLLYGAGGTMRREGHRLSSKYLLRRLASHLLLNHVYGIISNSQLQIGRYGKPAFADTFHPDTPYLFFNLSHGKDYTVMAVSDAALGIDIQEIPEEHSPEKQEKGRKKRELIALRSFPEEFRNIYFSAPRDREAIIFTRLWTLTEAILKAEGTGFACDLREHPELCTKWKTHSLSLADHEISLAMQEEFTWEIRQISGLLH